MKRIFLIALIILVPLIAVSCSGTAWVYVANEHETIYIEETPQEPTLQVAVNGEEKTVGYYYDEMWEITGVNLMPWEEVTVRATVSSPPLSDAGLFEESFRVKDGDEKDVVVNRCTGYQP